MLSFAWRLWACAWRKWAWFRGGLRPLAKRGFSGRTLAVNGVADIKLSERELVLTFDDGPVRGCTEKILAILDEAGVKATFLVIGERATRLPAIVRKAADRGHTIGSHTDSHPNLKRMETAPAQSEIAKGMESIAKALTGSRHRLTPFFRFPYLADTPALRQGLAEQNTVILDVDINTCDYFQMSPRQLHRQALKKILRRGSGVVLMHDIHPRTVAMLPRLLADLRARDFTIVHLVPGAALLADTLPPPF